MVRTKFRLISFIFCLTLASITSCTQPQAPATKNVTPEKKILVVFSSMGVIKLKQNKGSEAGYRLRSFAIPAEDLLKAGYTLVFATPNGNGPVLDRESDNPKHFKNAQEYTAAKALIKKLGLLNHEKRKDFGDLLNEGLDSYAGLFVPGGYPSMDELARDGSMGKIVRHFQENKKIIGMIGHGVAALFSTLPDPDAFIDALLTGNLEEAKKASVDWLFKGYRLTAFSDAAESDSRTQTRLGGVAPYFLESALKTAGAKVSVTEKFKPYVLVHDELVTAQNPASSQEFTKEFLKSLQLFWSAKSQPQS